MFEESRLLLEKYYCLMLTRGMTKRGEHLLQEVRARLRALTWLHRRLLELDRILVSQHVKAHFPSTPGHPNNIKVVFTDNDEPDCKDHTHATQAFQMHDELRVLLESFYYTAHRIKDIIEDHKHDLPGLHKFKAKGVTDVRNHLVEHPGKVKDKGVLVSSFAAGGPTGPQLKPLKWSLDSRGVLDQGLHQNAKEFDEALRASLEGALK